MTDNDPAAAAVFVPLSRGEVNFLWWFIQGSIMDADVRAKLRHGWGLCDRHTAAWLLVEAAFRGRYLHGPAVIYTELMEQAVAAFDLTGPWQARRLARRLDALTGCHLCALGLGAASAGFIVGDRLEIGRDPTALRAFMTASQGFWRESVCGRCAGTNAPARCRIHLCADLQQGIDREIANERARVERIARHLARYHASFVWEHRGTDTVEDRGALISAAGWCSGWRSLLALSRAASQ